MSFLLAMHARLLTTMMLVFGILALWGLVRYTGGRVASEGYRAVLWIGELLMLAQFSIGALLMLNGRQPARPALHIIYGLVAVLTIPATLAYMRERDPRLAQLVYALACLFLCGLALRALQTGA